MKQRQPKFDLILAEAVQEGLKSISPSVSSVVIFYLKRNKSIRSNEYIDDPQAFEEGLRKIFGFGAKVIEKKILEILYVKLELPRNIETDFQFSEEVKKAQKLLDHSDLVVAETL
jgi:hypothetical protein